MPIRNSNYCYFHINNTTQKTSDTYRYIKHYL